MTARRFLLQRDLDTTGISGVGPVAEGVAFSDGTVALRWLTAWPTSVVFHDRGIEAVEAVHGHGGATRIVWLDPLPAPTPEPQQPPTERPGPGNTGVPAGTKLTPSGSIVVTVDGTTLDALDISGTVTIKARNVTIRRTRIRANGGYAVKVADSSYTGLVIEDTEINGQGKATLCVGTKNFTLRRCNVHGSKGDLIRADGNVLIEDSWLHDPIRPDGGYCDGVQTLKGSNVVIRRSVIDVRLGEETVDPADDDPQNSCFIISAQSAIDNVLIEGNWLNGGNYTLYLGGNTKGIPVTGVVARGNVITGWRYGPIHGGARGTAVLERNVDAKGAAVS